MAKNGQQNKEVIDEMEGKLKTEKIEPLEKRVGVLETKCEYQKFQDDVEKIVIKTLGHDTGKAPLREYIEDTAQKHIEAKAWTNKQFWIPIIVSLIGTGVSIWALLK